MRLRAIFLLETLLLESFFRSPGIDRIVLGFKDYVVCYSSLQHVVFFFGSLRHVVVMSYFSFFFLTSTACVCILVV